MDSSTDCLPQLDDSKANTAFRKPVSDTANRKYRRHSRDSGSSSSDGNPKRSSSLVISKEDPAKKNDYRHRRKDDGREYERDTGHGQYGRRGDSHNFGRQLSRGSHRDCRPDKYEDADDRSYHHKLSSRSGRGTRDDGSGHSRSRDYVQNMSKDHRNSNDRAAGHHGPKDKQHIAKRHEDDRDEKRDQYHRRRSVGEDGKSESNSRKGYHRTELNSRKDYDRVHHSEEEEDRTKSEADVSKNTKQQEKRKYDDYDRRTESGFVRESTGDQYAVSKSKNTESPSRISKLTSSDKGESNHGKYAAETRETVGMVNQEQAHHANASDSATDVISAKVAAIKAAELVNRNLAVNGVGVLSTDQKKKLLWGNKKNTAVEEEPGHRWDTALFCDRERQEKFNKLMGVKGQVKVALEEDKPEIRAEKEKELQIDLEKQYTAGLRRRDGRTVGLGL